MEGKVDRGFPGKTTRMTCKKENDGPKTYQPDFPAIEIHPESVMKIVVWAHNTLI